jgi:hypothetical protein
LYMTYCRVRQQYGRGGVVQQKFCSPSKFLSEAGVADE